MAALPRARTVAALPLLATALLSLHGVTAVTTRRVLATSRLHTSLWAGVLWLLLFLAVVTPLLVVAVRTLDGRSRRAGIAGAYLYGLVVVVVYVARQVLVGIGQPSPPHVLLHAAPTRPVLTLALAFLLGYPAGLVATARVTDPSRRDRPDTSVTRSSRTTATPGDSEGRSRRTTLATVGGVAVALGGGAVVGRDLPVSRPPPPVPQVQFEFTPGSAARSVTVTHAGGDTFTAASTRSVQVRTDATRRTWSLPVSAGDSLTLEAAPGQTVEVVWTAPDGDDTLLLASYDVPR